jgi:hypothetical protein
LPIEDEKPPWQVAFSNQAKKQKAKLPEDIRNLLMILITELEWEGPEQLEWRNYGKLVGKGKNQDFRHCHLNTGKPRYVAVWKVVELELELEAQIMEIKYVGAHENADYRRIN